MAGYRFRKGIPRIIVPDLIVLPRPVIRAGLPCRQGVQDLPAVTKVGAGHVWITRWLTEGPDLPYDMDWLWYAAILAVAASAKADHRIRFQTFAEVQRMATQLGAGNCGTYLRRRTVDAMRRLCQARFGWARADFGDGNTLASHQLTTQPIFRISSALAHALWPDGHPPGATVDLDATSLWVEPTMAHLVMTRDAPFHVPLDILQTLAKRQQMMSLALVLAAYAQAASKPLPLGRVALEILLARNFHMPATTVGGAHTQRQVERARKRILDAAAWLENACGLAGFPGAVRVWDPTQENVYGHAITKPVRETIKKRTMNKINEPGRPKERWVLFVARAKPPFVRS